MGLAETALLRGDHEEAIGLCDRGYRASAQVADAAYLFPFLLTGVRARLAGGDVDDARRWLGDVVAALETRAIPGTLPASGAAMPRSRCGPRSRCTCWFG